jgi:hypothetical protein
MGFLLFGPAAGGPACRSLPAASRAGVTASRFTHGETSYTLTQHSARVKLQLFDAANCVSLTFRRKGAEADSAFAGHTAQASMR